MITRIALRNLQRNRWRSALTAGGIALAVAMLVWTKAWIDTFERDMIRAATAVETGQIQLHTEAYGQRHSIYASFAVDDALLQTVDRVAGVAAAAPRTYAFGLVGNETRSQVGRLVGVDPRREAAATLVDDALVDGRWLSEEPAAEGAREAVVGHQLAAQLGVGVGDELVVFLQAADGSLGNDLVTIVGTVKTANSSVDRSSVYLHRDDLAYDAALDGRAHELVVSVRDLGAVDTVAAALRAAVPPTEEGPIVTTWRETMADLYAMLQTNQSSMWITYLLVYAIAALGLLNTQRMSALERSREFGVLMAIGMKPARIGRMLVVETLLLTAVGALAGVALGGGLALYHSKFGLDMGAFTSRGGELSFMGVAFSRRIFFEVSAEALLEPAAVILAVALACGLVPARRAAKLDPMTAIAGRT
ncbi:MAG: ABC transporter permease [Myxococcales bacterium]|nr:ABC transporter permease [Myxococcales bacterium]MCB9532401.1 ABC transporter permease [Myxococcales bacterium]